MAAVVSYPGWEVKKDWRTYRQKQESLKCFVRRVVRERKRNGLTADDYEGWLDRKRRPDPARKKRGPAVQPKKKACSMVGTTRKPKKKGRKPNKSGGR